MEGKGGRGEGGSDRGRGVASTMWVFYIYAAQI